jgi:hypothetical protein
MIRHRIIGMISGGSRARTSSALRADLLLEDESAPTRGGSQQTHAAGALLSLAAAARGGCTTAEIVPPQEAIPRAETHMTGACTAFRSVEDPRDEGEDVLCPGAHRKSSR